MKVKSVTRGGTTISYLDQPISKYTRTIAMAGVVILLSIVSFGLIVGFDSQVDNSPAGLKDKLTVVTVETEMGPVDCIVFQNDNPVVGGVSCNWLST